MVTEALAEVSLADRVLVYARPLGARHGPGPMLCAWRPIPRRASLAASLRTPPPGGSDAPRNTSGPCPAPGAAPGSAPTGMSTQEYRTDVGDSHRTSDLHFRLQDSDDGELLWRVDVVFASHCTTHPPRPPATGLQRMQRLHAQRPSGAGRKARRGAARYGVMLVKQLFVLVIIPSLQI